MGLFDSLFNHWSATQQAYLNFEQSKQLQQHQFELNRSALQEYYRNNRISLETAGYNPLLAVPGSTAQGFSASANMGSAPGLGSGIGTDEVNSAVNAINAKQQRKLVKEQVQGVKLDNKNKELQNKKLENEITTSPKNLVTEFIKSGHSPTFNSAISKLTNLKNAYGLQSLQPRNFLKTNISRAKNLVNSIKSGHSARSSVNNGKPFELKATYYHSNGRDFDYMPELDEKGKLPPELAKYHRK